MPQKRFVKDPDARLDYSINWNTWLESGDSISTSTWAADAGLNVEIGTAQIDGAVTTVFVNGGQAGQEYQLTNSIVTAEGREDDRSITVAVEQT